MSENETRRRPHVLSAGWGTVRGRGLYALIMEVAFPTGAGLTRLFAGYVPCKRSVGLWPVGGAHQPVGRSGP